MKKIGFVVAIKKELQAVFEKYGTSYEEIKIPGYDIFLYRVNEKEIYIIHSGCGNISSATATQVLISLFKVEMIINFGVVGGLDQSLMVNDVLIVKDVLHRDFDTSVIDLNMRKHQYEMFETEYIPVDPNLLTLVKEVVPKIKLVTDISSDHFVDDLTEKQMLHQLYHGQICEMEAAGILITSHRNHIPCLLIKAVSDDCNGGGKDFEKNVDVAANKAVELVMKVCEKI